MMKRFINYFFEKKVLKKIKNQANGILINWFYLLIILLFIVSANLHSQNPEWINYTSNSNVWAIAEEEEYLWVGGDGGLTKMDRHTGEMTYYNNANSGLPGNQVLTIAIDEDNIKWIGTRDGGLSHFDGTDWTVYDTGNSGLPSNEVLAIAIDEDNMKWIGTGGGGLARFDGTDWTVYDTENSGLASNNVRAIAIDEDNIKWIGTSGGLARFDGTDWTVYDTENSGLVSNNVRAIAIDEDNIKWIGTSDGLARFDGTDWTVYNSGNSGLPDNYVHAIAIDEDNIKWIGTSGGLARFDGTDWTVYDTGNSGLPRNYVYSIAIDENNIKWIGTWMGGLARFDGTDWTVYNTGNSGLPRNYIYSIVIDEDLNKWIGTVGGIGVYNQGGIVTGDQYIVEVPESYILQQNYPNPFNPETTIEFSLSQSGIVTIDIFNIRGQKVRTLVNSEYAAGEHSIVWDGRDKQGREVAGGVYLYQLSSGEHIERKKMLLLK